MSRRNNPKDKFVLRSSKQKGMKYGDFPKPSNDAPNIIQYLGVAEKNCGHTFQVRIADNKVVVAKTPSKGTAFVRVNDVVLVNQMAETKIDASGASVKSPCSDICYISYTYNAGEAKEVAQYLMEEGKSIPKFLMEPCSIKKSDTIRKEDDSGYGFVIDGEAPVISEKEYKKSIAKPKPDSDDDEIDFDKL